MKRILRILVVTAAIPFLAGCVAILQRPLPEPASRPNMTIEGVILRNSESGGHIEYSQTPHVEWTDSTLTIIGIVQGGSQGMTNRTYRLSDVEAVLVRRLDSRRTSLLMAGVLVGVGALSAILFTDDSRSGEVLKEPGPSCIPICL